MTNFINRIGIETFGIISICLFVTVFTVAMIWSFCLKKKFLQHMESLPLEDDAPADNDQNDQVL